MNDVVREFSTARSLAEYVLSRSEKARNDDKWFLICCLKAQGMNLETNYGEVSWLFTLDDLRRMYAFETLTRVRRELQNEHMKYRASEEVQRARAVKEYEVWSYYGHGKD